MALRVVGFGSINLCDIRITLYGSYFESEYPLLLYFLEISGLNRYFK